MIIGSEKSRRDLCDSHFDLSGPSLFYASTARIEYVPPQSIALANALRQYRVIGTYKGVPLDGKLLSSGDRVMWAAIAARPELIPADVRGRDADPMTALEKHYRDHARGYISA